MGCTTKSELQYAKLAGQIQHMKMQQPLISWTSEVAQRFARSGLFCKNGKTFGEEHIMKHKFYDFGLET